MRSMSLLHPRENKLSRFCRSAPYRRLFRTVVTIAIALAASAILPDDPLQAQTANPPGRKTPGEVSALFSGPPVLTIGNSSVASIRNLTDADDEFWVTAGGIGRLQSAVYAGNPASAAANLYLYLYQIDSTGGNITN